MGAAANLITGVHVARIWSIVRLTNRAAPLINLSIVQHLDRVQIRGPRSIKRRNNTYDVTHFT